MIFFVLLFSLWFPWSGTAQQKKQEQTKQENHFLMQDLCFLETSFSFNDRSKDSLLSPQESKLARIESFINIDKNSDGIILLKEFLEAFAKLNPRLCYEKQKIKKIFEAKAKLFFTEFDYNKDHKITCNEFELHGQEIFIKIDTNQDRFISLKELHDYNSSLNSL